MKYMVAVRRLYLFPVLVVMVLCLAGKTDQEPWILDFRLKNIDGTTVSLSNREDAKGYIIIFTCNHCPFARLYTQRINALQARYSALQVPVIAINSMDTLVYADESFEKMREKAKKESYGFYYLQDGTQETARQFDARYTPTAFVVWKEQNVWKIKYRGAIDDNGENPQKAHSFVAQAVDELLSGKAVSRPLTEAFGCAIMLRK